MIIINLYENHIMCPAKCGSRFLDSIWDTKQRYLPYELLTELPKTDYIVIRNPYEHLISALHTDLLHVWNKEWVNATENDVVRWYSTDEGGSHYWTKLYKTLYEYWEATNKNAKIILLHQLSSFIDKKGIIKTFNEVEYQFNEFDIWKSKDDIIMYLIDNYPNEYHEMMKSVLEEQKYYHMFLDHIIES